MSIAGLAGACAPEPPPTGSTTTTSTTTTSTTTTVPTGPTSATKVSVSSLGVDGNADSFHSSMSADGRLVAFASKASNLVTDDTNGASDVFVRDLQSGETSRISVASNGSQADDSSLWPSISADGRYVAYFSMASNLVAGDTNWNWDVFVHDRHRGTTTRTSVSTEGLQSNGGSASPAISADGRYVAFVSLGDNLVAGDANDAADVFVHDLHTGETTIASLNSAGQQALGDPMNPITFDDVSLSSDGRFVAFSSNADTLVQGDTNSTRDVFVRDRQSGVTERVSVSSAATEGNSESTGSRLSSDGRFVVFQSWADNLVTDDNNNASDIFVRDRLEGTTKRASVTGAGVEANGSSSNPTISLDGNVVAFDSLASNLDGAAPDPLRSVFVHDRASNATTRVLATASAASSGPALEPSLGSDGRLVAFSAYPGSASSAGEPISDVYLRDLRPGE